MKDLKNFCKLFDINIPVEVHKDYYFDQLEKSGYNPDIKALVEKYIKFENDILVTPYDHKRVSMEKVIKFIKESNFYQYFNEDPTITKELADYKIETFNQTGLHYQDSEKLFLSIDMTKANYQILRNFDETGVIGQSWGHFLGMLNIDPIYEYSKPFRQHILGNLNPRRIQRHQAIVMDKLSKEIGDIQLISKSHDELIYLIPKIEEYPTFAYSDAVPYKFTQTIYRMEQIGKEKYVKKILGSQGDVLKEELKGVEGNMFYMYLQKYIIGSENYDERDLYFMDNKRLAKWVEVL